MRLLRGVSRADLLAAAACLASVLGCLGARDIEGVRERRIAGTAADIDHSGRWLLPRLLGEPRYLKPPLADWAAAASIRAFGRSELAFRLPFALAGLGTVAAAWYLGRDLSGPVAGRAAALILATSLCFVFECHSAGADILLAFTTALALAACFHCLREGAGPASWWCFHGALGLGILAKGPVALAVVAVPVALDLRAGGRWEPARRLRLGWGLLLVLLIALPWPIAVALRAEDAPARWLADMRTALASDETGARLGRFHHLFHFPWFAFPWTVLGAGALVLPLLRKRIPDWPRLRLCSFWLTGGFLLFCLWDKQPIHYLLPLAAPLAVLEGALCARLLAVLPGAPRWGLARWTVRGLAVSLVGLAVATAWLLRARAAAPLGAVVAAGAALALPALLAFGAFPRRPERGFTLLVLSGLLAASVFSAFIQPARSREKSGADFARAVGDRVPPGEPIHFTEMKEAMPFYADREFRKLSTEGGPEAVAQRLAAAGQGYLLLARETHEGLAPALGARLELETLVEGGGRREGAGGFTLLRFSPRAPDPGR